MTAQIIHFPASRITTASRRVEQVIQRAHELRDLREIVGARGFKIGDRVQHVTYRCTGVITEITPCGNHCRIEIEGARRRVFLVESPDMLIEAKEGAA